MSNSIDTLFWKIHHDSRSNIYGADIRRHALLQLRALIEENEEELLAALESDLGKSRFDGYLSELYMVLKEISHSLKHLQKWMKPKRVGAGILNIPAKAHIHSRPKGVVLIISPWNYPFQLLISPLVGAIAAGNRVILKPSEMAPATSAIVAKLIPKYMPEEMVSVIEGAVEETTTLLALPFDHIFYTGNGAVGRIVMGAAAKNLTPVTLELGGKSPAVVWGDNDLDLVAKRIIWGKTLNCGQTCVAPDYVITSKGMRTRLVEAMKKALHSMKTEDGKIINDRHFNRLKKLIEAKDYEPLVDGVVDPERLKIDLHIVKANENSLCMQEEIFGPILPVLEFDTFDEVTRYILKNDRPLAAYIFSSDAEYVGRFKSSIIAGGICVRDTIMQLTSDGLPFGGVGESGIGNYHGKYTFETFSHPMSVLTREYYLDLPARYPPYGRLAQLVLSLLRFLSKF